MVFNVSINGKSEKLISRSFHPIVYFQLLGVFWVCVSVCICVCVFNWCCFFKIWIPYLQIYVCIFLFLLIYFIFGCVIQHVGSSILYPLHGKFGVLPTGLTGKFYLQIHYLVALFLYLSNISLLIGLFKYSWKEHSIGTTSWSTLTSKTGLTHMELAVLPISLHKKVANLYDSTWVICDYR